MTYYNVTDVHVRLHYITRTVISDVVFMFVLSCVGCWPTLLSQVVKRSGLCAHGVIAA